MTYALDTNIISYLLKDDPVVYENYNLATASGEYCVIPPVAYYEIRRGLLYVDATTKLDDFGVLCSEFDIGEMSGQSWDEAAQLYAMLRKERRLIEDADIFIAAFCITGGYTLVTHNTKHFEDIDGLQIVDWAE